MEKIKIKKSKISGRGIFAVDDIKRGTVIEKSPYIYINCDSSGEVNDYTFHHNKRKSIIALVHGSLFNHNDYPNIEYEFDTKNKLVIFRAISSIPKGKECFISYGDEYWKTRNIKRK